MDPSTRLIAVALALSAAGWTSSFIRPQIVNGSDSDPTQDNVVLVMHYDAMDKDAGAASGCTGTLLTPQLVLTARHCVSQTDDGWVCNEKGEPIRGGAIEKDFDPSRLFVFTGVDRPNLLAGAVPIRGREILTTGSTNTCNNDIAMIVLEAPVQKAMIAPVRFDGPQTNEIITVVGWGISESDNNPPRRRQRSNVKVTRVGPGSVLGPSEFETNEGTCAGDSGGPAFAASGAVLGVVSGGRGGAGDSGAEACIESTNIFTSLAGHADFLKAGYAKVGQSPWLEGDPNPLEAAPSGIVRHEEGCASITPRRNRELGGFVVYTLAVLLVCSRRKMTKKIKGLDCSSTDPDERQIQS